MPSNEAEHLHRVYWAKYDQDTSQIHRLEHHLADVGAVMKALLQVPSIRRATAKAGGLTELDQANADRICVFAALHDIGKTNLQFQAKANPALRRRPTASHTKDMMQLLNGKDIENQERFMEAIPWLKDAMSQWDQNDGNTVCGLIIAMLSHHGKPEQLHNGHEPRYNHWQDIQAHGRTQPFDKIEEIASQIPDWFPEAFRPGRTTLPSNPEFQHHFLGLLMLADWIGSDTRWFPFRPEPDTQYIKNAHCKAEKAIKAIGIDTRKQTMPETPATLAMLVGKPDAKPNAIQRAITQSDLHAPVVILESETGSGKTEAALLRFQQMKRAGLVDGIYFALPTRAAATQIHGRITRAINQIIPDAGIEPVLAIPGYTRAGEHDGTSLERYRVHWEDGADEGTRWAAESSKRFLTAQVAVGTIDQAMLSVMQTKHAHLRAVCLARNLLVIDEIHASDTYMRGITQALIRNHILKGGYTLMMSATLGAAARSTYLEQDIPDIETAKKTEYPCISTGADTKATNHNGHAKTVSIETMPVGETPGAVAKRAIEAQQAGAKVLVIRNTVRLAVETVTALEKHATQPSEKILTINGQPAPHHSRFAPEDRRLLDQAVERALSTDSTGKGIVVVGTQTLEQSLDIDADYLITDLCPMDVLLQRIGRLHRKPGIERPRGHQEPKCTVLMPSENIPELIHKRSATGLGLNGGVYQDLRVIEATRRQIAAHPVWKIPEMNRELVEESTHPERLNAIAHEAPETWTEHQDRMLGMAHADRMAAENILVNWKAPFYDPETGANDEVIFKTDNPMTRLADPSIDVDFAPNTRGPFGTDISKISIPYQMIGEGTADLKGATAEVTETGQEHFTFRAPTGEEFRYSRSGLTRKSP